MHDLWLLVCGRAALCGYLPPRWCACWSPAAGCSVHDYPRTYALGDMAAARRARPAVISTLRARASSHTCCLAYCVRYPPRRGTAILGLPTRKPMPPKGDPPLLLIRVRVGHLATYLWGVTPTIVSLQHHNKFTTILSLRHGKFTPR
jgi:hypothetical protein